VIASFELCYRALELGERVRRRGGESEGKKVARRPGEDRAVQDGRGRGDRRRCRCRPAQEPHWESDDAHADRAAGLWASAMLVTLGSIVRRVTGRVSGGSSGRGGSVVQRTLVHFRPDHGEAEPQRQGSGENARRPVSLHARVNLRDPAGLCEAVSRGGDGAKVRPPPCS
jgi:hypothetical protein